MTNGSDGLTAEDIVLALPTDTELLKLRAKVKRFKPPEVSADGHWKNSKVGVFITTKSSEGVLVSWNPVGGLKRAALWEDLCKESSLAAERLELGWMIANMLRIEAVRVLNAISGPNEAMAEADFYRREEKRWRKWALVGITPDGRSIKGSV